MKDFATSLQQNGLYYLQKVTKSKGSNRLRRRPSYSTVAAKAANICRNAETSIELFREDGFSGHEVTLEAETPIVGIFGIDFRYKTSGWSQAKSGF